MIRTVIADDSPTSLALLESILRTDPEFDIVGRARDGEEAVRLTRELNPGLVTMDIEMPKLNGFEATQQIMREMPRPIVIVSGLDVSSVGFALNAMKAGALAVVPKPVGPQHPEFDSQARHLLTMARAMSHVTLLPQVKTEQKKRTPDVPPPARRAPGKAQVVAIAASTGGPPALNRILSELPADFRAPILVVQHIATGFAEGLATWLANSARLKIKVAQQGERLQGGTVYLAPDGKHLGVAQDLVTLSDGPPIDGFKPSGTFLFESIGRAYGSSALGLILTGMGHDGVKGLATLRAAGGTVIAQDKESSVIFGMNGEAVLAGLTDDVLPLDALAYFLMQSV